MDEIIRLLLREPVVLKIGFNFRDDIIVKIIGVVLIGTVDIQEVIFGRFLQRIRRGGAFSREIKKRLICRRVDPECFSGDAGDDVELVVFAAFELEFFLQVSRHRAWGNDLF